MANYDAAGSGWPRVACQVRGSVMLRVVMVRAAAYGAVGGTGGDQGTAAGFSEVDACDSVMGCSQGVRSEAAFQGKGSWGVRLMGALVVPGG